MTIPVVRPLSLSFYAKDASRLARFYEAVLGLQRDEDAPTYTVLVADYIELVVVQAPEAIVKDVEVTVPPRLRASTPIKASFLVSDIEQLRELVHAQGGGLKDPSAAWSWNNVLHLDGWDPEGNVFQLRQRQLA